MGLFSKLFGDSNDKQLKALQLIADKIELLADKYAELTDAQLAASTIEFKQQLNEGATLDDILIEAFAAVREVSTRVLGMRHFYVQLLGGIALHQGRVVQMSTGEGKTLTATLACYLNALSGNGVHIVTVNSYLARRDAEWMGKIYKFLGLSVGVIAPEMTHREKKKSYQCDITYGTNNEFGFDYLRDNMVMHANDRLQRKLNFAIIDEVDSILIDEARTPLIISGKGDKSNELYFTANRFAKTLTKEDYELDEKDKTVRLTDSGIAKAERFFKVDNLSDIDNTGINHYINQALRAHVIMHRDDDYIVEKGEIIIVDEFTGRKMEGRRYSNGLHQAIEAKENVRVKEENRTLATITFQNYFRLYAKLSGMTGTAKTEEGEFNSIYNLDVVVIPTNMPMIRNDYDDVIYSTRDGKLRAIVNDIIERNKQGQPILVGTITVDKSEELSKMLSLRKISHNVLNAKNHEREAEIVAQAGRYGAVTIATNMAGRGTDILLGGNPDYLARKEMEKLNFTSEDILLATSYISGDERIEQLRNTYNDLYKKFKVVCDNEKVKVIEAGGLHILGTERHESRRIDNQLRGRSGRQGDIGSSVFFISLEDDLARIFGGERMQNVFGFFKVDDDTPIAAKMLTTQIENAQKNIEGKHFASRKYVLQYDDVNNIQRNLIYGERNKVLDGVDIHKDILDMANEYARKILEDACHSNADVSSWNINQVYEDIKKFIPTVEISDLDKNKKATDVLAILTDRVKQLLDDKVNSSTEIDYHEVERIILLRVISEKWINHLDDLDELKQGIGLNAIGNRDPVVVYKNEAHRLFTILQSSIEVDTVRFVLFADVRRTVTPISATKEPAQIEDDGNTSRNASCPCGSGKKYKHCCGK